MTTEYHAKYFAHELSRIGGSGVDRLGRALFDACVDLNPHQIEAALFALRSHLSKGVLLADEVGLGKTIAEEIKEIPWNLKEFSKNATLADRVLQDVEIDDNLLDEILEDEEDLDIDLPESAADKASSEEQKIDIEKLNAEIEELEDYI